MNASTVCPFRAVVFDRDDTLTVDVSWTYRLEDFRFVDGAPEAVAACNRAGLLVFVATNQGGIGKGLYDVKDMHRFHWKLKGELAQAGAWIDEISFCPHYPHAPGSPEICACRKPNPGQLSDLARRWELLPAEMVMIGDKETDVDAAERAGAMGYHFQGGNLLEFVLGRVPGL